MSDPILHDTETLLRDALHVLPPPAVSADFDARVLAALHAPPTLGARLWQAMRGEVRPLLAGAACAVPVTLLALAWTLHAPVTTVSHPSVGAGPALTAQGRRSYPTASLDALLDRPNLTSADVWRREWETVPAPALPPPAPRRRACLPSAPTLTA